MFSDSKMKTVFDFTFEQFSKIANSDDNPTKWLTSKKFSLIDHPDVWFCVMYRPTPENDEYSGCYVEPLDLGSLATLTAKISLSVHLNSDCCEIFKTTECTFDSKKMSGHGWPAFIRKDQLNELLRDDCLHIKCQLDVLRTTPVLDVGNDRYTFFTWSLNGISAQLRNDTFELSSESFSLASRPDLRLSLVARRCKKSKFMEIRLVPTEKLKTKLQISYLIWVEEARNGVRIPTWMRNINFDFGSDGLADTKFILYEDLRNQNCPFIRRDCLQFHCQIYHDVSTIVEEQDELKEISIPNERQLSASFNEELEFALKALNTRVKPRPYSMAELEAEISKMEYEKEWDDKIAMNEIWKDKNSPIDSSSQLFTLDMLNTPIQSSIPLVVPKTSRIQKSTRIWCPPIIQEPKIVEHKILGPVVYYMEKIEGGKKPAYPCEIRCGYSSFSIGAIDLSSQSNVFKKIILQTKWEGNKLILHIDEKFGIAIEALVDYLKFGEDPKCHLVAHDLFLLCNELEIPALKSPCIKTMIKGLSIDNVCETLTFAIQNDLHHMVDKSIEFAARNFGKISKWDQLYMENPELGFSLYETILHLSKN